MENNQLPQGKYLFTSESVSEGHPDKMCDQISDAVLDALFAQDPHSRVAVECLTKTGFVVVAGEVTTKAYVEIANIAREVIKDIGYDNPEWGFDGNTCGVMVALSEQSPDISQGVSIGEGTHKEQGAGDQGLMFGYATNETPELMPLPIILSHKLLAELKRLRVAGEITGLGPDAKSQVTVEYDNGKPIRVDTVVISSQHKESVQLEQLKEEVVAKLIKPVCGQWLDENSIYHVNPTGKFVFGGPVADAGVTGRKIIVDTYGGHGSHGGGAFSGKDPSKVDRSAAYAARYIAKNLVAAGLADKCEVQLAYAIGVAEPVSILVNCFGTNRLPEEKLAELVRQHFPLKPFDIITQLNLRRPIFRKTAAYGHFGRDDPDFTWERTDKAELLKQAAGQTQPPQHTGGEVQLDASQ
jgi:S-adenosylmethionine synthetase